MSSASFSMHSFLNRVDGKLLEKFAEKQGIDFTHNPKNKAEAETERFYTALGKIPANKRVDILSEIFEIDDLATNQGGETLYETAHDESISFSQKQINSLNTNQTRALFFYLHYPGVFKDALEQDRIDNLQGWRVFPLSSKPREHVLKRISAFETAVQSLYRSEHKGDHCKAVVSEREDRVFITVFIEDSDKSDLAFERNSVNRYKPKKPVLEAFFSYQPETGILDMKAKGGKDRASELQEIFSEQLLEELKCFDTIPEVWDFGKFQDLDSLTFPTEEKDKVQVAQLLELKITHGTQYFTHTVRAWNKDLENGCSEVRIALGDIANHLQEYTVNHAVIKVVLKPENGTGRDRKVTVQISRPNRHNLKSRPQDIRVRALLEKWGIALI